MYNREINEFESVQYEFIISLFHYVYVIIYVISHN
jgi:hypothetical protein